MENTNIFQVFITDDDDVTLSDKLMDCVNTVQLRSDGYNYRIFKNGEIRKFIKECFDLSILKVYDNLIPYAYKADLARYCLLYFYGGWYFDITLRLNINLPRIEKINHIFFTAGPNPGMPSWDVANGLFYADKNSKILETLISEVVKNYNNDYYGINALCPTGPNLMGRIIASYGPQESTLTGNYLSLTPQHAYKNFAFVMPNGEILAFGKATTGQSDGSGLLGFNINSGNHYGELYRKRSIYLKNE